jgi:predicted ester cyclase
MSKHLFIIAALAACSSSSAEPRPAMTTACSDQTTAHPDGQLDAQANKRVIRSLYEDCINPGRLEPLAQLVSDDYVGPRGERGVTGFTANLVALRTGFPDIHFTLDDLVAEGDRVSVRWSWRATHAGEFNGLAPTDKQISNTGMAFYQLADHKIIRSWVETDRLGALQQLGAVQMMPGAPSAPVTAQRPHAP